MSLTIPNVENAVEPWKLLYTVNRGLNLYKHLEKQFGIIY